MRAAKRPGYLPPEDRLAYQQCTERDNGVCGRCLRQCGPVARDHRKNRSQGGLTVLSNLQLLGLACHTWKTEHPADAVAEGWAVPGWADPLEWPARRWVRTLWGTVRAIWVLYVDEQFSDGSWWIELEEAEAMRRMGRAA